MRLFLTFLFLSLFSGTFAQSYTGKVKKKAQTLYESAIERAQNGEYEKALKLLDDAVKTEPGYVDAYLSMAGIAAETGKYTRSIQHFEKAFSLDSLYSRHYLLPYSISLAGAGKFADALAAVSRFLQIADINERSRKAGEFRKKTYEFAVDYEKNRPVEQYVFAPENLGDSINSTHLEYFPSLTVDGKTLVFTRRIGNNEDFYESKLIEGNWSEALPLPGNLNTPNFNEGAQNISQDGRWLLFTGCNFPEGYGSCDLYISYLTKKGWSQPQNLGRNVNTEFWESSPSLSPDKRALYFSSSRPGGYGGTDIWVSYRNEKGEWGKPENLGPTINTAGDEGTPFIHADNQTLYFNSNGHPGYSEKPDLFMTRKSDDGSWGKPLNLGYPINTIGDEGSLVVAANGKTAYYSSDRSDSRGGLDIYTFELREDLRPRKTLWVQGKVYDAQTGEGLPSTVELTDLRTNQLTSKLQTDEDGNYLITLPVGNQYAFNVNRKGYLFFSEHYDLPNRADTPFTADIPLKKMESRAKITLKNIFFDSNETTLKPESGSELDRVVLLLKENPALRIQINGFTDSIGSAEANLLLSQGRAKAVTDYLISKGISPDRLAYKGFGAANPVADNSTEEGRAQNRRTELEVR